MRSLKKTISVLLIHAFLLSSLPAGVLQPAFAAAPDIPVTTAKEITTNPDDIVISRDYGIVKSKFVGKNDNLIIHIQDAHCNYEAQSNIAKIIEGLVKNDSLSFVSVEGADGLIDTSWFKAFPDAEVRKEVANYFMKKGEITGPEFLSITTDLPIKLFGAETREYYIQNLNAFTASYPLKEETEKYLNSIKAVLNKLQDYIYNADLKAMDSKSREHESKAIQFNEYVRFLQSEAERHKINLRQYENLFKLINVLIYEKKIDFSVTDKERSAVIDELSKILPKDTLTELVNKSISFKVGKISSAEYYDYLRSLATKNGIELLSKYPNLSNYIIYNSVYSKIDNEKLFNDIKEVEAAIKEKLFENEDQRTLERLTRHIDTLLGLINIKLLNGEFEYFKTHKEEFTPESFTDFMKAKSIQFGLAYEAEPPSDTVADSISKLEDFYAIAIKRDKALVDNTLEGMKKAGQKIAVLVTGGFHSEGMAKLLEKQGISYIVVCPNITKDVPTPYIQVLTNQRTSFEDILSTPQEPAKHNMLAPALFSWMMGLDQAERDEVLKGISITQEELHALIPALKPGLEGRLNNDQAEWINMHLQLWLRKAFTALKDMGQNRMADEKKVLKDAYRMAMERSIISDGANIEQAEFAANDIMNRQIFIDAFNQAYSDVTVPTIVGGVGAIRLQEVNGMPTDVSQEDHGTRLLDNAKYNRADVKKDSVNGILMGKFDENKKAPGTVYSVTNEKSRSQRFMLDDDAAIADINLDNFEKEQQAKIKLLLENPLIKEGVRLVIVEGLTNELSKKGIAPDLVFHPGVTRRAAYMDGSIFRYLLLLENGVDLIIEAVRHEMKRMEHPGLGEAEIELMAPTTNVRAALSYDARMEFILNKVSEKRAKMNIESEKFEVGKEYKWNGKTYSYKKPQPEFAKFATSGVRWLVEGIYGMFKAAWDKVKAKLPGVTAADIEYARKYGVLVSNKYTQADFTMPNVGLVTKSIALYNLRKAQGIYETVDPGKNKDFSDKLENKGLLLFYDNRPGSIEYVRDMARILAAYGIKVTLNRTDGKDAPVLLAALSLMVKRDGYAGGIYLTASHNGDEWNGIKFNAEDGAPSAPKVTDVIGTIMKEEIGRDAVGYDIAVENVDELIQAESIAVKDATTEYVNAVLEFMGYESPEKPGKNIEAIRQKIIDEKIVFIYSAFYGSSGLAMKKLCEELRIPKENIIEIEKQDENIYNPTYEPSLKNLKAFKKEIDRVVAKVKRQGRIPIVIGASSDNDADRYMISENGVEIEPGRATAILGHYLVKSRRGLDRAELSWGRSFVSSHFQDQVARLFGQNTVETPTGFKYAPDVLATKEGGILFSEESFGLSFNGWTLDKDGVLPALLALELVATTDKSLTEYEKGIKEELRQKALEEPGKGWESEFIYKRYDKRLTGEVKDRAVKLFKEFYSGIKMGDAIADGRYKVGEGGTTAFAGKKIVEIYDSAVFGGLKFIMEDGSWVGFRTSGTEPVIRFYIEAKDFATVHELHEKACILTDVPLPSHAEGGRKLHSVLDAKGDKALAAGFLKAGYNKDGKTANIGYGVEEGAAIDGSFAIKGEGSQGYYVDEGKQFIATVQSMRTFFTNRAKTLGKEIRYVIKPGIGGQHTPFQGIAAAFQVIDMETGMVVGEYELGKNYEEALGKALAELGAGWDQIAVIPSSKSGSTDETMMIFSEIFYTLLKKIAEKQGLIGEQFADTVFKTLHDINFENGVERKSADLFKGFNLALLTKNLSGKPGFESVTYDKVLGVFQTVLGNMFFETTDRPSQSRLAAFLKNSGLDKELGAEHAPGFGAMFDNVGGRWTADLHMMTFLAYHKMSDDQIMAYWQSRYSGINDVRDDKHLANRLAKKILGEGITDIALVVPDELFWFGKSIEQNFNESIWQKGSENLVAVKASDWEDQKSNYAGKAKRLVVDLTGMNLDMKGCDLFKVPALYSGNMAKTKENLAIELGRLSTTFYGTTYTVGMALIERALARAGYTWADVDVNDLNNPATRIMQRNLYLRQPYVELGKGLLEKKLGDLQEAGPGSISAEIHKIQSAAGRGELVSNIEDLRLPDTVTDMDKLAETIYKAVKLAEKENRKFVPFIYLEGEKYHELRRALVRLGIEWVMQGTGDQHISYQQVLAQPQKYLPFIISFVPEEMLPGRPAIGFAKGYLNNISQSMVRDLFAEASYRALTEPRTDEEGVPVQGAKGIFLRLQDSPEKRAMLRKSFEKAAEEASADRVKAAGINPAEEMNPGNASAEDIAAFDKENAEAFNQTLVKLGINPDITEDRKVLIIYDTDLYPQRLSQLNSEMRKTIQAAGALVSKYMNGKVIEVRGTGSALLAKAKEEAGKLKNSKDAIVMIAGDETLAGVKDQEAYLNGLNPNVNIKKIINVQNPDGDRYIPVRGLYDLALRIAYEQSDERILECLERIATAPGDVPFTSADLIKKGVIRILPKIRPQDMNDVREAYKAAQIALKSL